jgi:hypothetical protein
MKPKDSGLESGDDDVDSDEEAVEYSTKLSSGGNMPVRQRIVSTDNN